MDKNENNKKRKQLDKTGKKIHKIKPIGQK